MSPSQLKEFFKNDVNSTNHIRPQHSIYIQKINCTYIHTYIMYRYIVCNKYVYILHACKENTSKDEVKKGNKIIIK